MNNPLFSILGGNRPNFNDGGFSEMLQQLNEFKRNFRGDPKQKVQEMLNSGQMTQEQFNMLSQMTNQFMAFMKK